MPWSMTAVSMWSPSISRDDARCRVPSAEYLMAFERRLSTTCRMRSGSTCSVVSGTSAEKRIVRAGFCTRNALARRSRNSQPADRLPVDLQPVGLDARDVEQLGDEAHHPIDLAEDRVEVRRPLLGAADR